MYFKLTTLTKVELKKHGGKVLGLYELICLQENIPKTFVLPSGYHPTDIILSEILTELNNPIRVIVRSSSQYEDIANSSMAGVFNSVITPAENINSVIKSIRDNAKIVSKQLNIPIEDLPLIIQPVIDGPYGGVYLSDENKNDQLIISSLGVTSVTSGTNGSVDTLLESNPIFINAQNHLRILRDKFSCGIDVEFVIDQIGNLVLLQKRENNSCISSEEEVKGFYISNHFPFILSELEGTIWQQLFDKLYPGYVKFHNSRIYYKNTDEKVKNEGASVSKQSLENAYNHYYNVLFPKWEKNFHLLLKKMEDESSNQELFHLVFAEWQAFYLEYFYNPHRNTISQTKNSLNSGVSLAPCIINWINSLYSLRYKLGSIEYAQSIENFLDEYYYYFLTNNCFSDPPIDESVNVLHAMIRNLPDFPKHIEIESNPTLNLKVSWISEEDNRYKNMYNYLIRKAIKNLSSHLILEKKINDTTIVWNISINTLKKIIDGDVGIENVISDEKIRTTISIKPITSGKFFKAEILSKGKGKGKASRTIESFNKGNILIRTSLEVWDYPLFLNSSGAIVCIGSSNYHSAIFARDVGIPLYKSKSATVEIEDGMSIILDEVNSSIQIFEE